MAPSAAAFIDIEQRAKGRVVPEQIIAHERRGHAVLQQHMAAAVARLALKFLRRDMRIEPPRRSSEQT